MAEAAFKDYLQAYNSRDLAGVLAHLKPDCIVVLGEHELARGVENLKPMYEMDFGGGSAPVSVVEMHEAPNALRVKLRNPNMPPAGKLVDVTYHFEPSTMLMCKHVIHGVEDC